MAIEKGVIITDSYGDAKIMVRKEQKGLGELHRPTIIFREISDNTDVELHFDYEDFKAMVKIIFNGEEI